MTKKDGIRRAILVEGRSIRNVALETGHSRNTISKMLEESAIPRYSLTGERACPVLGPYKDRIDRWVERDEKKPKKKRRTARRMYHILRDKYGYRGAESTIRRYVGFITVGGVVTRPTADSEPDLRVCPHPAPHLIGCCHQRL